MKKTINITLKTIKTLFLAFVILIATTNVIGFVSQSFFGTPLPMVGEKGFAIVQSGSMSPTLEVNDMIFFDAASEYHANDIVVFNDGNHKTVHRIVKMNPKEMITKGDFNNTEDEQALKPKDVIGKVMSSKDGSPARIPWVGHLYTFQEPYLWVLIGIVLAMGIWDVLVGGEPQEEKKKEEDEQIEE